MAPTTKKPEGSQAKPKGPNLEILGNFFEAHDVEWRAQKTGYNQRTKRPWIQVIPFITNRGVMARLDEACTPAGWRNEYQPAPSGQGVICGISIKIDGEWVTKWDGAENTHVEPIKGGLSAAMKRAAVQWGIGRYLYIIEAQYVELQQRGQHYIRSKKNDKPEWSGYWDDPKLPKWAVPGTKEEMPKNFKWVDPQDLEVIDPVKTAEEQAKAKAEAEAKAKEEARKRQDPRVTKLQDLLEAKVNPEDRPIFMKSVINKQRPKSMGEVEMLIAVLQNKPDAVGIDEPLDEVAEDDGGDLDEQLNAAMEGLDNGQ